MIYNQIVTWTAFAILAMFTSILGSSIDLNFQSTTAIQKMRNTLIFFDVLELSSTFMELGIWMLEENHVCTSISHLMSCLCLDKLASCVNMKETETEYE